MSTTSLIPVSEQPQYLSLALGGRTYLPGHGRKSNPVADLAVQIWARRERGREVLKELLDLKVYSNQSYFPGSDALAPKRNAHAATMRTAASHDQLQMQLVDLCWLLEQASDEARRLATRSQLYFWSAAAAKLVYSLTVATRMSGLYMPAILWGCVGITSMYGAYRAILWSVVYLCQRRATMLKHKLDTEQLAQEDGGSLSGWTWDWVRAALH